MNKILLSCAILGVGLAAQAQQTFTIKGKFSELKGPQKIALKYGIGKNIIMDSTTVINGAFSFNGKVQYPVKASLYLISLKPSNTADKKIQDLLAEGRQDFFVEPCKITVTGKNNMKDALIKGGKTQGEYLELRKQVEPLKDQYIKRELKLLALMSQKEEAAKKKSGQELTPQQKSEARVAAYRETPPADFLGGIIKVEHDFIRQHPDSYVSFDFVRNYSDNAYMDFDTFESLYNSLSQRLRDRKDARVWPLNFYRAQLEPAAVPLDKLKSSYSKLNSQYKNTLLATEASQTAKLYLQRIKLAEAKAIGSPGIPIKKVDINGNPVNWESFKGKYLLLEFWSSWCGGCRKAHPHLKELYAKYKNKGFEILSISDEGGKGSDLEKEEKRWKAAIKKDGLPWPQVLNDLDREKFDAFKAYNTGYEKILLDKEGKILLLNYSDVDLDKILKQAFGF